MNIAKPSPIPVTIVGGYLGAGKTTLINHLLRNAGGQRLAILVNEFGDLSIDADLIEAENDQMISLSGGCVCCSYGNDMLSAMAELVELKPKPDHVVLEASGVAIPEMIANSISLLIDYRLDGVLTMVDVSSIKQHVANTYVSDTITRQLVDADIILLNKADLVGEEELAETTNWIEAHAPDAVIVPTTQSNVPIDVALQGFERITKVNFISQENHHTSEFKTETIYPSKAVDAKLFGEQLIESHPGLVRAKGFVEDLDGTIKTVQIVGKRLDISPAPDGVKTGIVLIFR